MKQQVSNKVYIITLIVLSVFFLGLMFLSTTFQNSDVSYSYEPQVVSTYGDNIRIGDVTVTNNGFLPAKIKVKSLIGCIYDNNSQAREVYISYSKAIYDYMDGNARYSVEVSAMQTEKFNILANYLPTKIVDGEVVSNTNFDLYLFENGVEENSYGYCLDKNKADTIKIINVKIQNGK